MIGDPIKRSAELIGEPITIIGEPALRIALTQVSVEGVVRTSEKRGGFVPDNAGELWYWLDVPAMARAGGLPPETPLIELLTDTSER